MMMMMMMMVVVVVVVCDHHQISGVEISISQLVTYDGDVEASVLLSDSALCGPP